MILHGDCLEVMPTLDAESIDAIVTDPPYGLEFMGKAWDKLIGDMPNAAAWAGRRATKRIEKGTEETGPTNPWGKETSGYRGGERHGSKRCRVCGRRQFSGTPCQCPEPDWEMVYPKGAPSGAVAMGRWHEAWATEALRVAKPGAYLLAFGGTRTVHRLACAIEDAGWIIRDLLVWGYASGFPKGRANLKPAWEPIVMARKPGPLRPLAIDECRIAADDGGETGRGRYPVADDAPAGMGKGLEMGGNGSPLGRWPANVILTDEVFGDDVSRFFLIPKAARSDREPVLGGLETTDLHLDGAFAVICAKCNRQRVNVPGAACQCDEPEWVRKSQKGRANVHPTVKPTELMRHLVRLVTPQGGTVLDPFLGSGTTALAAEMEGFAWVGIEREAEYVAIAEARLNGTQKGLAL